jgi:protein translocase SecG subunit
VVSVGLVICVISQTTKHEGLGVMGGSTQASFRGRPGLEDRLQQITMYLAVAFMVMSFLSFIVTTAV